MPAIQAVREFEDSDHRCHTSPSHYVPVHTIVYTIWKGTHILNRVSTSEKKGQAAL